MSEHSRRDIASLLSAAGFIVIGAFALWGTRDMSALGSVFPRTISSAMIIFAAIYIVWRWLKPHFTEPAETGSITRRALLVIIMLAWALLLHHVGFLSTSVVAALLLLLVANYHEWTLKRAMVYIASVVAVVGGLYSVFAFGLQVPLPEGILF